MSFNPTRISADFSCAPQIALEDIPLIAAQGYKTILNCRPDGEGGADQPTSLQLQVAAGQHGLEYYHFPVTIGSTGSQQAQDAAQVLTYAHKPVLGFCKSGMRATNLYNAAMGSADKKTLFQWLKGKCLITRLWRWCKHRQCASSCCK